MWYKEITNNTTERGLLNTNFVKAAQETNINTAKYKGQKWKKISENYVKLSNSCTLRDRREERHIVDIYIEQLCEVAIGRQWKWRKEKGANETTNINVGWLPGEKT